LSLRPDQLENLWTNLADPDGIRAYRAIWTLAAASRDSVPFLAQRVRPMARAEDEQLARWIADLDSAVFADRDKATRELERQGEVAEPLLRKALTGDPSPEVRRRIEALRSKLHGPVTSADALRSIRAVEVLEHIATPEARQVLQNLATGAADARLTREAKAALARQEAFLLDPHFEPVCKIADFRAVSAAGEASRHARRSRNRRSENSR
jgi:hypothetical protein